MVKIKNKNLFLLIIFQFVILQTLAVNLPKQNYIIKLPEEFYKQLLNQNNDNNVVQLWHPSLSLEPVDQTQDSFIELENHKPAVSFLQLKSQEKLSAKDTPGQLYLNSPKLNCACKFVKAADAAPARFKQVSSETSAQGQLQSQPQQQSQLPPRFIEKASETQMKEDDVQLDQNQSQEDANTFEIGRAPVVDSQPNKSQLQEIQQEVQKLAVQEFNQPQENNMIQRQNQYKNLNALKNKNNMNFQQVNSRNNFQSQNRPLVKQQETLYPQNIQQSQQQIPQYQPQAQILAQNNLAAAPQISQIPANQQQNQFNIPTYEQIVANQYQSNPQQQKMLIGQLQQIIQMLKNNQQIDHPIFQQNFPQYQDLKQKYYQNVQKKYDTQNLLNNYNNILSYLQGPQAQNNYEIQEPKQQQQSLQSFGMQAQELLQQKIPNQFYQNSNRQQQFPLINQMMAQQQQIPTNLGQLNQLEQLQQVLQQE